MSAGAVTVNNLDQKQRKQLSGFIDEIAKYEAEKKTVADDIKDAIQAVSDKLGLSKKVVKQLVKERGMTGAERQAQIDLEHELDAARLALGDFENTPLGEAALISMQDKADIAEGTAEVLGNITARREERQKRRQKDVSKHN